jgi:hypothetical protein
LPAFNNNQQSVDLHHKCQEWLIRQEFKIEMLTRHRWLTPIILATEEAEIRRISGSKPWQIVPKTLSQKNPSQKRAGE